MKQTKSLHEIENIAKNLVFIDGIARSGKSIFSNIIPSFEDVEHIQFMTQLEHIIPSVNLGGIDIEYAKMILRLSLNELSYNIKLSRNVNFRAKDQTGIANYKNPDVYWDRLNNEEGDYIVQYIQNHDTSIPFVTHDLMVNLNVVERLDLDYKIIELYRNPIDNFYSWYTKGWGERFGKDPRAWAIVTSYNKEPFPWYCSGYEEKMIGLNSCEVCVIIGVDIIKRSIKQYKNSKLPGNILTILYEDMLQDPYYQLEKIESFLGKKKTKHTKRFVTSARCPRVLDAKDRERKLQIFKDNVNTELFESLVELSELYERNAYGIL